MIKTLKVNEPLMTTYPHHANLFSMLDLDQRSLSWVYHNYLLVMLHHNDEGGYGLDVCSQYYPWHQFKMATCPMIITRVYESEMVLSRWKLQDFLVDLLQKDNYIYFLRKRPNEMNHELFISGFDSDQELFLCHDFWDEIYQARWLPYDEIRLIEDSAFYAEWSEDYLNGIWAIEKTDKYKAKSEFYYETVLNFTKEDLLDLLNEYMGISNHVRSILRKDNRYVGIEIYDMMTDLLDMQKERLKNQAFAIHPFQLLYEHKKLLMQAIQEFFPELQLRDKLEKMVNDTLVLRNLVMYSNVFITEHGIYKKYDTILEKIKDLKAMESEIMTRILNNNIPSTIN